MYNARKEFELKTCLLTQEVIGKKTSSRQGTRLNMYVHICTCMYACVCVCICVCMYVCMHVYICMYVCMYILYVHVYLCVCIFCVQCTQNVCVLHVCVGIGKDNPIFIIFIIKYITMATTLNLFWFKS